MISTNVIISLDLAGPPTYSDPIGWHEERDPNCKTPLVCSLRQAVLLCNNSEPASSVDKVNEARTREVPKNCFPSCNVLTRFYDGVKHPKLSEINEHHGA